MKIYITHLLQILNFSSPFRRFEIKNFLRRSTMVADNISNLVAHPKNFFHFYGPVIQTKLVTSQGGEEITCLVKNNTNILLQTANALVTDKNETPVCAIKLLLDVGSQQTFITQRVVDELTLKPLREINMEVSSFLSKKEGVMKLKEYQLNVKNMDSSSGKLIKCLCLQKICPNIKGQSVKQELKKQILSKHQS